MKSPQPESSPCLPQLESTRMQQQKTQLRKKQINF